MSTRLRLVFGAATVAVLLGSCRPAYDLWVIRGSTAAALRFGMAHDRDPWFRDPEPVEVRSFQVASCRIRGGVAWEIEYHPDTAMIIRDVWSHRTPPAPASLGVLVYAQAPNHHYVTRVAPLPLAPGCYAARLDASPGTGYVEFLVNPGGTITPIS